MKLSKLIIERFGSLKRFSEAYELNYGSLRYQLAIDRIYGKYKQALIKSKIVGSEAELERILKESR